MRAETCGGCSFERSYFCSNSLTWVYTPPGKSVLRIVQETSNLLDLDLPAETGGSSPAEPGFLSGGAKTDLCLHLNIDRLRKRPGLCCKYKSGRFFCVRCEHYFRIICKLQIIELQNCVFQAGGKCKKRECRLFHRTKTCVALDVDCYWCVELCPRNKTKRRGYSADTWRKICKNDCNIA